MFASITTRPESSSYIHSPPDLKIPQLTTNNIIKHSHLRGSNSGCDSRIMGKLSWIENEQVASLNSRVDFINKTVSTILATMPAHERSITLVSLGSGGLLTEYFIHQQLKKAGYQDINWRIIDADYQNGGFEDNRKEFREKVTDKVKAFTAEQAYLNKSSDEFGEKLAAGDKHRGAVVVLSINPPTILSSEIPIDSSYITLRGSAIKDASKANAIYLIAACSSAKETVQKEMNKMYSEMQVITSECVLKYSVNSQGYYKVNASSSHSGNFIKNGAEVHLKELNNNSNLGDNNITLSDIDQALDKYILTLPAIGAYGMKIFVSDYDQSIIELNNFFTDSHNETLFASFDKNHTSFERKE